MRKRERDDEEDREIEKKKNKKKGEKFVCARNIGPVDHAGGQRRGTATTRGRETKKKEKM